VLCPRVLSSEVLTRPQRLTQGFAEVGFTIG
jgi:hypothetical protein